MNLSLHPRLFGKCNWLKIPKVDRYDRVDIVCPTLKIAVNLLDGYSRPTEEMNENLFRRRWNGTEQELQKHIENGTLDWFCERTKSGMKCKVDEFQVGSGKLYIYRTRDSGSARFWPKATRTRKLTSCSSPFRYKSLCHSWCLGVVLA